MEIITADWETYYAKDYTLSKMTMEEYIRSDKFEAIMLGLIMPDGTTRVITGTHEEIKYQLDAIEWGKYAVLCHNTLFDAAIFSWVFDVRPRLWLDTLSMSRAMFGSMGNSLKTLAEKYALPPKGTYVANMMGVRRGDIGTHEWARYSEYCLNDCEITLGLFKLMVDGWYSVDPYDKREPFPKDELKLIDKTIRMFAEPMLRLNPEKLKSHYDNVVGRKQKLLDSVGVDKKDLMSNVLFADLLSQHGVEAPKKISPKTGKEAYAFAKTDEGMKALSEHPSLEVQALVAARLGVKSTLEETRTQRFMGIVQRGKFPVPLRYSAARTKRWAGADSINLQNLPARGMNGGAIKRCIEPPEGYVIIDSDSSNIEARGLPWVAEQEDLLDDFRNKIDVYCKMATGIYGRPITKADKLERFVGKTVVLGAGYGTGAEKLQNALRIADPPVHLQLDECDRIIKTYRFTVPKIVALWRLANKALQAMHDNHTMWLGREGCLWVEGRRGIRLPNGLYLTYPQLHKVRSDKGDQWQYKDDYGFTRIYGAKLVENVIQALARIIIGEQLLRVAKKYRVVMTVHDAIACLAKIEEKEEAAAYVEECMRWVPPWATGWPLDCEYGIGTNYGEC